MVELPLIHLVLGNAPGTGKTQCAALLADYFRHQKQPVSCFDVCSQGSGLSGYRVLEVKTIYQPVNYATGDTKELGKAFAFSPEVRIIDCSSRDFETMCRFISEHRLTEQPGWMVHYPVTPATLKEAHEGLLKLAPLMPFPLVLWRNGLRQTDPSRARVLAQLTLSEADLTGHVEVTCEDPSILRFCEERSLLLSEVETGLYGIAKVPKAKQAKRLLAAQLDRILKVDLPAQKQHEFASL